MTLASASSKTIALITMNSMSDKAKNVAVAESYIREAAKGGADWIMLPEMFHFHGPYSDVYANGELDHGDLYQRLSGLAKELNVCIFAGSIGERSPDAGETKKVYNTQFVFDRHGVCIAKYRKIHLFNLRDGDGKPLYCESDGYLSGDELIGFTLEGYRIALATCYDLRFPEMFLALQKAVGHFDVLVAPSAFTFETGRHHWELLLRARAVESQCYVCAANQVGEHGPKKRSFGHSMIVDPWGDPVVNGREAVGVVLGRIEPGRVLDIRARLPALTNKKLNT